MIGVIRTSLTYELYLTLEIPDYTNSDFGHEADMVASCQNFFWRCTGLQQRRHKYSYSVNNVTIEAFWAKFRRLCSQKWMDIFDDLVNQQQFNGSPLDKMCLRAVFMPLVRQSIAEAMDIHDNSRIRNQPGTIRPPGYPDDLYQLPEIYGQQQCGMWINDALVDFAETKLVFQGDLDEHLPPHFKRAYEHWLGNRRVTMNNAPRLYKTFRHSCRNKWPHLP